MGQRVLTDDAAVRYVQGQMARAGFYTGPIDGQWGGLSDGAFQQMMAAAEAGAADARVDERGEEELRNVLRDPPLLWGAKVSREFRDRVHWIAEDLEMDTVDGADDLMTCMALESGRTFAPDVKNMAGSGATGLIQFMPATARSLGTSVQALEAMTAEDQLNYVYKYFRPFKGRLQNLGDVYMAILWPAAVGRPDSYVLWEKGKRPTTYRQNAGLDVDRDGRITRGECLSKLRAMRLEGAKPGNMWEGGQ